MCDFRSPNSSLHILLYADTDLNLIDGSSVWTASIAQVLAKHPAAQVTLLLKRPLSRSLLTAPLEAQPNIRLLDPWAEADMIGLPDTGWRGRNRLQPEDAAQVIAAVDERSPFDLTLVRGLKLCQAVAEQPSLNGRIWAYLTDFTDADGSALRQIYRCASRLLCQTQSLSDHLRSLLDVGDEKLLLLPPMIPDMPSDPPAMTRAAHKLVYVGKLAPLWRTEDMAAAMVEIRTRFPSAEFHVAGDKFHNFPPTPNFPDHMRRLLEENAGVVWHQAMSREQTQELIRSCDVGCSWRHPDLDGSLELSTKVLEYGAHGKPVLLNRVPMHEELLGEDYPLFCNSREEFLAAVARAFEDADAYALAARRVWEASRQFTFSAAFQRLAPHLPPARSATSAPEPASPSRPAASLRRGVRVVFAGHDLKFAEDIMADLVGLAHFDVRVDQWAGHASHDERESQALAEWADVVVAEWCLGNAAWYSQNLPARTGLVVRLHRVELETDYPEQLNLDNVHRVVTVSPHFREQVKKRLSALGERAVSIPNAVECDLLDQPKLGGSEFRLGLLGVCPRLKRLDLALDIFEGLRRRDRRYVLFIKGKLPTEYPWVWREEEERKYYLDQMARINRSPWRDSVVFDPFGKDVSIWLSKIGFILSTSDIESFHLSVAEGMASGAVPVVRLRDEVPDLYPSEYCFGEAGEAVALIERLRTDEQGIGAHSDRLKSYARENFDRPKVALQWEELIQSVADNA